MSEIARDIIILVGITSIFLSFYGLGTLLLKNFNLNEKHYNWDIKLALGTIIYGELIFLVGHIYLNSWIIFSFLIVGFFIGFLKIISDRKACLLRGVFTLSWLEKIILFGLGTVFLFNFLSCFFLPTQLDPWWHNLAIPKLYLQYSKLTFIKEVFPHSLFFHQGEILFLPCYLIGKHIGCQLFSFIWSVLTFFNIFNVSYNWYKNRKIGIYINFIFFSSLTVIFYFAAAMVDMINVFLCTVFLNLFFDKEFSPRQRYFLSGFIVGYMFTIKMNSGVLLGGILIVLTFFFILSKLKKNNLLYTFLLELDIKDIFSLFLYTGLIVSGFFIISFGWLIRNYIFANNPVWPFLGYKIGNPSVDKEIIKALIPQALGIRDPRVLPLNIFSFIKSFGYFLFYPQNAFMDTGTLSPFLAMFLPIGIITILSSKRYYREKFILLVSLFFYICIFLTFPIVRYFFPILIIFSILSSRYMYIIVNSKSNIFTRRFVKLAVLIWIFISIFSIFEYKKPIIKSLIRKKHLTTCIFSSRFVYFPEYVDYKKLNKYFKNMEYRKVGIFPGIHLLNYLIEFKYTPGYWIKNRTKDIDYIYILKKHKGIMFKFIKKEHSKLKLINIKLKYGKLFKLETSP